MSYWQGQGKATGYSRAVEQAHEAVRAAEAASLQALQREYPIHSPVRVVHHRGAFMGQVVGHECFGARVIVRNMKTEKLSKWWAAHVELASAKSQKGAA